MTVRSCTLAVHFERFSARRLASGATEVRWTTVEERGSLVFTVERASERDGSFSAMAAVEANGSGGDYRVLDESGLPAWYRVVEYTAEGRGDETPAFRVPGEAAVSGRGRRLRAIRGPVR